MQFEIGKEYSLSEIKSLVGVEGRGGKWVKGYLEHNDEMFIFANTKSPGFGGQDYENKWLDPDLFLWSGDKTSKITDRYILEILKSDKITHLFVRDTEYKPGANLVYHGPVQAIHHYGEAPIYLVLKLQNFQAIN